MIYHWPFIIFILFISITVMINPKIIDFILKQIFCYFVKCKLTLKLTCKNKPHE